MLNMPLRVVRTAFHAIFRAAETLQVELHGRYSEQRIKELAVFHARTTRAQAAIILFGTTVPCLLMPIVVDLVKLPSPSDGPDTNWRFFIRTFVAWWFFSALCINQCRHYVHSLWLNDVWLLTRACVVGGGMALATYFLATVAIGFPVPFTNVIASPAWVVMLCSLIFFSWHRRIKAGTAQGNRALWKAQIITWAKVWTCQCCLLSIYPAYFFVFTSLPSRGQLPFACLLPVLKVLVRNWLSRALGNLHDEKTESVILNADVFSSLFVAYCMQSVPTMATTGGLMAIDYLQLIISTHDLIVLNGRILTIREQLSAASVEEVNKPVAVELPHLPNSGYKSKTVLEMVSEMLDLSQHGTPRDVDGAIEQESSVKRSASSLDSRAISKVKSVKVIPGMLRAAGAAVRRASAIAYEPQVSTARLQQRLVYSTRRMLYFTEFLALLSYVEVVIPFIYSVFLMLVSQMPNREHYAQTKGDGDVFETVRGILFYGFMEFVSFIVLEIVMMHMIGISAIVQVAFLLQKQTDGVQTKFLFWVFYFSQASLDHNGYDYTFKFHWLLGNS